MNDDTKRDYNENPTTLFAVFICAWQSSCKNSSVLIHEHSITEVPQPTRYCGEGDSSEDG
jgi:hypothetical protein